MKKRRKRNLSLNLILWFTFLIFAIVLIVFFTLVQNFQMNRQYREQLRENLINAGIAIKNPLSGEDATAPEVSRIMLTIANEYGVSAYLFSENGEYIYPDIPETERENYAAVYRRVKELCDRAPEWGSENFFVPVPSDEAEGYATKVEVWGKKQYLYLTSSYEPFNEVMSDMAWLSVLTALFAVAFSFVVSGFVSMLITKPVTEVTERAKELARGNYDVSFQGKYFCTEVTELSEALDYARSEIGKTDRMQKELIANVSHDFKTPLTMIKAYAAMIREISGDDPEKRAKHTQIIIDESDRLASLVGDLLDLSRLQAVDEVERTVFNLSEDVYSVVSRFGFLTETGEYTAETDIDDDLYTYAGKGRVEQVLYNLIGNAFNYTGEDKRVVIRLKRGEKCSHFEVIDSGKGIPPEEIDTIWERYYRSSEMHKRPVKGTGLGLSIVKNVLIKHNIPFGVKSEPGKGSCFWVDFPEPPEENTKL